MKRKVYVQRDQYGACVKASFTKFDGSTGVAWAATMRQLAGICMHGDTTMRLFNSCWRDAVRDGAVDLSKPITKYSDDQDIEYAEQDAQTLDAYASAKVNNERSSFYIYGGEK
jgi:hypothetical protein